MFQTFISRHNSNFFSDKLVLTSGTPASSAPVLQTPKATSSSLSFDFFFQAEDGIRYLTVTGVQTCALPIFLASFGDRSDGRRVQRISAVRPALSSRFRVSSTHGPRPGEGAHGITDWIGAPRAIEIGRASCRERV